MAYTPAHLPPEFVVARRKRTRRRLFTGAVAAIVAGAWGIGYASTGDAAWVATGAGNSAPVSAGGVEGLTIAAATSATGLVPDGSRDVTFTVHNPNPFSVRIDTATVTSIAVSGGSDPSVCTSATIAGLTAAVASGVTGATIDAGGDSDELTVTVSMSTASVDECQGVVATPNVSIQASAVSA